MLIMVNMRTYFSDEEMERFLESVCLHDFKVLLLESASLSNLKNAKRYTIDADLCDFCLVIISVLCYNTGVYIPLHYFRQAVVLFLKC